MMKKTIAVLLSLLIVFSIAACGNSEGRSENSSVESTAGEDTLAENKDDSATQPEDTEELDESAGAQPEDEGELVYPNKEERAGSS